ncbi:MAG TPA: hypothetical protein VK745_08260 [Polyangiaceae bacterium]|nr:hypothetical protein [Polyangiaceae bacterium]
MSGLCWLITGCGTAEGPVDSEAPQGEANLGVKVSECPLIDSLSALPLQTSLGNPIELSATPSNPDQDSALSFVWYASSGTFRNSTLRKTTYICDQLGNQLIFLIVGNGACGDQAEVPITCDDGGAK